MAAVAVLLVPMGLTAYRVAAPWDRADCAGAAAYVLAQRSADEPVFSNHWEYEYYFRRIGNRFHYLQDGSAPIGRVWVALTSIRLEDRALILDALAQRGRLIERREFAGSTAALLEISRAPEGVAAARADE